MMKKKDAVSRLFGWKTMSRTCHDNSPQSSMEYIESSVRKNLRQQNTVTRTSCNFVADLLTIQPTGAHSDAPNKGEEDKLQQKSRKTKMFSFPPRRLQQSTQLQPVPIVLTQQNVITSQLCSRASHITLRMAPVRAETGLCIANPL